ncbi:MAG: permease [Candidatus Buchananbacteria bacterium]
MQDYLFAIVINGIIFAAWLFLLFKDRRRGMEAVKIGCRTIIAMLPLILIIIGAIGLFSAFIDPNNIANSFGEQSGWRGFFIVALVSSFLQIPGIIAFPIAATLYHNGAAAGVVAVFACASTMASIFTLPLEMKFLGKRLPFLRLGLTFVLSLVVGVLTGAVFNLFK